MKNKRKAFSVAEATIALLIGSIALGMAAPMITKQIKFQNMTDTQNRVLMQRMKELDNRIQELENGDNAGVPVGTVAFFNLAACPDDTWQNVTELGWGGQFFRVADASNPRNTQQEQSVQEHWHELPTFDLSAYRVGWDTSFSVIWVSDGLDDHVTASSGYSKAFAGKIFREDDNFTGVRSISDGNLKNISAPKVSNSNETRPKNIPLTTCVKIR